MAETEFPPLTPDKGRSRFSGGGGGTGHGWVYLGDKDGSTWGTPVGE